MTQSQPPPTWQPEPEPDAGGSGGGLAIASLVLGIISMFAWCCPLAGLPISIVGLVLGVKGKDSPNRTMAIMGIVLNSVGLVLTIVNGAIGAYMGVTGQNTWLQNLRGPASP